MSGQPSHPQPTIVTTHAEAQRVLRDPATFSAHVNDGNGFSLFGESPIQPELDAIMANYLEIPVLMRTDPPEQKRVRDVVARVLTPDVVRALEPSILDIVEALAAPWLATGQVEFVAQFAAPLPGAVSTQFICGEPAMRESFRFWAAEIMSRVAGPQPPERQRAVARNIAAMAEYFLDRIAARRRTPGPDLISLLANATDDQGAPLEDVKIVNVLETFMVGGNETTTFLLGESLLHLVAHPDLADQLRTTPAEIPAFIEEMLRLAAPAQAAPRKTTVPTTLAGTYLPAGTMVMVNLAAANRDPAAFPAPQTVDLARPRTPRHLAFGDGNHACLGLQLARAEARIAFEHLLPRMQALTVAPGGVDRLENDFLRGPIRLEARFRPA